MKLEWSDDALADLDRFVEFLSKQRPSLASAVASQIIAKVEVPRSRFSVSTRGLVGPSAGARSTGSWCCRSPVPRTFFGIASTASVW
jgi:plasmid stabilization system protein ParE